MCLAPAGSIPPPIDMDGLAIGIELDISGIGDLDWPAAAGGCPELPHAAATSASAPTPTAAFKAAPGRQRPGDTDPDMDQPPHVPAPVTGRATDCSEDASKDAPTAPLIAYPARKRHGMVRARPVPSGSWPGKTCTRAFSSGAECARGHPQLVSRTGRAERPPVTRPATGTVPAPGQRAAHEAAIRVLSYRAWRRSWR